MGGTDIDNVGAINTNNLDIDGWSVVDMETAGADPTGNESITPVWDTEKSDNTILVFPAGEYYVGRTLEANGITGLKVWAPSEDVTFSVDSNTSGPETPPRVVNLGRGANKSKNIQVHGITVDRDGVFAGVTGWYWRVTGTRNSMRKSGVIGRATGSDDAQHGCSLWVHDRNSQIVLDRCYFPDGADAVASSSSNDAVGIFIAATRGTKYIYNCEVGNFANNGIYATGDSASISGDRVGGPVNVIGGVYYNSNREQVRIGPGGSTVRDTYCYVDSPNPNGTERGIWLQDGRAVSAVGNRIVIEAGSGNNYGVYVTQCRSATVKDNYIAVDGDSKGGIRINPSNEQNSGTVRLEGNDVQLNGTTRGYDIRRAGTVLVDCAVYGSDCEFGFLFDRPDCRVVRPRVDTNGNGDAINGTFDADRLTIKNPRVINASRPSGLSGDDIDLVDVDPAILDPSNINAGVRQRWNGIIGGGRGGVDLSSVTGQFEMDKAMADGTSGASQYALALWDDANSQWQYINPSGTI